MLAQVLTDLLKMLIVCVGNLLSGFVRWRCWQRGGFRVILLGCFEVVEGRVVGKLLTE
jgi:hypothetical protein